MNPLPVIEISFPSWIERDVDWARPYTTDEDRIRLAVDLARQNVEFQTGGPFGAAVFESDTGRLVAVGVNRVVPLNNCTLHAEMLAFMMAQTRLGTFSLGAPGLPRHELFTSCDPCAMCLGATLWSGVKRLVCSATRDDAAAFGFDEGPVFDQSYAYLEERGVEVTRGLLREEGRRVLERYAETSGVIYNG